MLPGSSIVGLMLWGNYARMKGENSVKGESAHDRSYLLDAAVSKVFPCHDVPAA